ncbi:HNH endonuclease domain-containing protein [Lacinutrix mariniflava]|uniref:HNH endonuclease domain-containing protein n=1 Tax=Lacinutrix mariniflava TaxID=342955 RepID=UPI0006E3E76B|nr:HNH endonuclease domain-containing protein [Lacinutrix mariniflava]
MIPPSSNNISVSKLSSVFKNTSATYKFYWFWAILESVEEGNSVITKKEIFSRMIKISWYTVNYYRISFGKQDLIQKAVEGIKEIENLQVDSKHDLIFKTLLNSTNKDTLGLLNHFNLNVPHKFLSPWLGSKSKSEMYKLSTDDYNATPYSLYDDRIEISESWLNYFNINSGILKTFCYWNLTLFLQSRNPNVHIPNKISRPIIRGSLNKHKTKFWDIIIKQLGSVKCIYTNENLKIGEYVVEHFIPYQFVAHDLMWNLIPAESSFNSKKSDKLPKFEDYFDSFYEIQKVGFDIIKENSPKNKFLEDYLPLFPSQNIEKKKFENLIKPLLTIANNNGFQYLIT